MSGAPRAHPDPFAELRLTALATLRGASYWSRRPVTRADIALGAYEEISTADVPGVPERLRAALPGLVEHRCSVGRRGGFLARLRRGTYAAHVVEHVALELQTMLGHEVGYGRTRGSGVHGEYTVALEHAHAAVGRRAAVLALDLVQRAFAGLPCDAAPALAELRRAATAPDEPRLDNAVWCGVSGGAHRAGLRDELQRRGAASGDVVAVSPAELLQAGLPYARADRAVVLDAAPNDVPRALRERERAERLLSVMVDGVRRGGTLVAPAAARDLCAYARDEGCRVVAFAVDAPVRHADRAAAHAVAWIARGQLRCDDERGSVDGGALRRDVAPVVQLTAWLALGAPPARVEDETSTRELRAAAS